MKIFRNIIFTLLFAFGIYYFFLPPLNITSMAFWTFALVVLMFYMFLHVISEINFTNIANKVFGLSKNNFHLARYFFLTIFIVIVLICGINLVMSPLFSSKSYAKRIIIDESGDFVNDVALVDFDKLPLLDKSSSQKLGDRVMGQLPELVSQFYVSDLYTQINYNDKITRVTPLEYSGIIKYFTNRSKGVAGYITVDSVTGESNLIKLEKGMKYMPSAYFFENLDRKLRFKYPTLIFGEKSFEIDNDGNPFWIVPTIKYTGVNLKSEISGIIIFDPIDGDSKFYKINEIPTWVDHVYSAHLIIEQINDWGKYKNGYFNSIFGQKNVVMATSGYNYTVMNDDVYLYTGITSVSSDEANIGFVLCNMRTKETVFYAVPGAEEYSAMASAEGQVQQMNYQASFPLLINLNNKPTYLMSLKDNAGLVKMYAFVDVIDYQKVVVTDASKGILEAAKNYLGDAAINDQKSVTKDIQINSIVSSVIDGNTYYYITDIDGNRYRLNIKIDSFLIPFLKKDDKINITYNDVSSVKEITKIN